MTPALRSRVLLTQVARAVASGLPAGYRAVVFGSRATGRSGARSDWDIGIIGPEPLDGAIIERLLEALDALPTLSTFDVVDLSCVPSGFRERAMSEGVPLE